MLGLNPGGPDTKNKNGMHPQDMRNMFVFLAAAALLYFTYDAFVLRPQAEALKQQRIAQTQVIQKTAQIQAENPVRERTDILKDSPRISIGNEQIAGSIALRGGRIDDLSLHHYFETLKGKDEVVLLAPKGSKFPRTLGYGWAVDTGGSTRVPGDDTLWRVQGNDKLTTSTPVTLVWDNGQGQVFENTFSIDENYLITLTQKVTNNTASSVTLHPYGLVAQTGLPHNFVPNWIVHEGPVGFIGDKLEQVPFMNMRKETAHEFEAASGWVGFTEKYWFTSVVPAQGESVKYRYNYVGSPPVRSSDKDTGLYQVDFTGGPQTAAPGQTIQSTMHFYAGPKKVIMLSEYGEKLNAPNFDLAVDFGWFWFMTKPFFFLLHYIGELTPNFGFAIIILTFIIRMAVFPLTNISYRSFAKMKKVAPQITELRKIYGEDKQKLQEEIMALYTREKVNPLAGCLPIIVQIPIFFALYKTLVTTIEMRHAPFIGWIHDLSAPDPTSIFNLFGLIPWDPPAFLDIGIWPCLMLIGMLIQKQLNPPPQDPIQRDLANYFPFIITYMMAHFASGLVIYWTVSAFIGIAQQVFIMKSLNVPVYLFGEKEQEAAAAAVDKGPAVHPLIGMVEKDAEESLFGDDDAPTPGTVSPPKKRRKKKK
jgi:YidC/Oxa1 family membrane protein insertase